MNPVQTGELEAAMVQKSQLSLHLSEQNSGETEKCLVIAWAIRGRVCGENSTPANSLEQRGFH